MSDETAPFSRLKNWPADRHGVDVHGTDQGKLLQVVGVGMPFDQPQATVFLNFVPSAEQLTWTPPDA